MAKKRTVRRRRATGYTVGTRRIRRRKMNGARSPRRRMNAAGSKGTINTALKVAVGALAGGVVIGMTENLVGNFYVRAGATAALGLVVAKMVPKAKEIGIGITVAGVVGAGHRALSEANLLPSSTPTVNGARKKLTSDQLRALTAKLKQGGYLNGSNGTLNQAGDGRMVISSAQNMFG